MTLAVQDAPFDLAGPLPTGVTVLEASAGTGKTYTIAGLAARYVAEGVAPLEQLLVVTFTRMATAELRDRVRERLVSAEHGLERALAGKPAAGDDAVLALLATGDRAEVERRRRRLAAAVAGFDAATIVTTHGFCQEVLGGLGIAGDLEPGVTFVEDLGDLLEEVVDDLYVRAFHKPLRRFGDGPPFTRDEALEIARAADGNPGAPLEPIRAAPDSAPDLRRRFAEAVRVELDVRKRRLSVMTYDDLLTRLDAALADDAGGALIAARLRARHRTVLVDEFQDTDPLQWRIVRRAFGEGGGTLVLIGDPKQAIYAFRGADVHAYLDAAREAGERRTLDVNWRSDQPLLDGYDALFGDAQLGHEGIVYRRARAAPANACPRLTGAHAPAPLRVRIVPDDLAGPGRGLAVADARDHIVEDVAADVVALLDSGALLREPREDGAGAEAPRPVAPGDIAVLVRRNVDAESVRAALDRAGVPAVLTGAGTVFATPAATDWLRLLEALERPSQPSRARAAALTAFLGWRAARVATASEDEWDELQSRLHRWAHVLQARGVAALTETISLTERLPERVLAGVDGERELTDVRHVGELLHAAAMREQLGLPALATWLRHRIRAAGREGVDEDRTRRLESDAAAVQVLTIHRSKGLEFPVVYLPFLWDPSPVTKPGRPATFHDGATRKVDVGLEGAEYQRHRRQSVVEQRGEDLRLMYVGMTRARHQAVLWWAPTRYSKDSALGRLVFHRAADGAVPASGEFTPTAAAARARLEQLAALAPGRIGVERAVLGGPASWSPPAAPPPVLAAATFDRPLDREWRRTSFSDITAAAHDARVASEPEEDGERAPDEPEGGGPAAVTGGPGAGDDPRLAAVAPLSGMPGGPRVGTLVHEVLEVTDFTASPLADELAAHVEAARARRRVDIGSEATLVDGLRGAIETPLGAFAGDLRLRDVARADRLDELAFELPLAGGDAAAGEVALAGVAAALRRHLPPHDPLAGYADRLGDPALRRALRGYLTGTIDLVLRLGGADGQARFAVVDYKTNRLAAVDEPLTAWHHRPAALAAEMRRSHYGLQALLYTVALHRFLRWRIAGYAPGAHLAGVLYLFVRGMTGPDTPEVDGARCGVFAWRPPGALVTELSDVLDGRGPA